MTVLLKHRGDVHAAAFSPDSRRVVTASDNTARVWDAMTRQPVPMPLEHQRTVIAVAFSPDGTRVVTATDDAAQALTLAIDMGSLEDWRLLARCSPFALVDGALAANPDPLRVCPRR